MNWTAKMNHPIQCFFLCLLLASSLLEVHTFSMMAKTTKSTTTSTSTTSTTRRSTSTSSTTISSPKPTPTMGIERTNSSESRNGTILVINGTSLTFGGSNDTLLPVVLVNNNNSTKKPASSWEEGSQEESVEFLETVNGDKLVKGEKVVEVRTPWNTHVGDDDAEATE